MQQLATPDLQEDEVLVKVTCCTICGSDLHTFSGRRKCASPCVLGHEIIGTVESWAGAKVPVDFSGQPVAKGQRITWSLAVGCGDCFYCNRQMPQKCVSLFKYGHNVFDGKGVSGGLSEYCVLKKGTPIFPIDSNVPDAVACPANCATATVMAAIRVAEVVRKVNDSVVLVTGMGMLGLSACAILQKMGAKQIIAVDPNQERLELATRFGANVTLEGLKDIGQQTGAGKDEIEGVDFAFEFSGVSAAVKDCLNALGIGGVGVLAGSVFPSECVEINPEDMVRKLLTVRGIHNYTPKDLESALKFVTDYHNKFPFAQLVSRTFPLEETEAAFRYSTESSPVRVAVVP